MEKIGRNQFFEKYSKYSNFEELITADILVMPYHIQAFSLDQDIFRDVSSEYNVNCKFYSDDQNVLWHFHEHAISPQEILKIGEVVLSSIAAIVELYRILKDRTEGKKFRITHILSIGDFYFEEEEFEGTIEDYRAVKQILHNDFENLQK